MPEFGGVTAGNEVEEKKRSAENVGASIANAILVAIVSLFAVGSLWLGIFAIPAFFAFFKASVVTISSIREGVNQLQAGIPVVRPLAFRSLKLGAACGLVLTFLAGGLTILFIELLQWGLINDNEDAKNAFTGVFRILGAILFTHLAVSVLQQGTFMVRSASYYQEAIEKMKGKTDTSNGPERSQIFYMGLGASLREGMESYIYMIPLGGAYDSKLIPLPAVLGAIGGLLAARYIAPALIWGGIAAFDVITPDSGAKSWTIRREALTNQYVSRLAAQATGKANVSANGSHYDDDGEETKHSNQIKGDPSNNLSHLSAEAIQNLFKDSNVDPEDFDGMDYAQKRLLLLKSSKALMESDDDDDDGDDHTEDKPEPAVLVMQNLHQRVPSSDANGEHHPGETSVSGQSNMFHRRRPSLMSIAEDEDGYLDRGGYSDSLYSGSEQPGHAYGVSFSGYQGSVPGHRRQRSGGSTHSSGGGSTKSGPSVHFQDDYATGDGDDDDAASVMQGFEHRHLRQAGARNPKVELEVMASTLSQLSASKERRGSSKNFTKLKPGSPKNTAPRIPGRQQQQRDVDSSDDELDIEASIGGNFALGRTSSKSYKSKRSSGKSMPGSSRPRHYRGSSLFSKFAGPAAVTETEENDDEDDNDTVYNGRNAVPEDFSDKSFIATICLAISAFVMFVCCAGLFKMGVLDMKGLFTSSFSTVFDMCGCCEPDEDGSVSEAFFAIFESQFGYTCEETTTGLIAWLAYWLYPFVVMLFTTRAMCFSGIPEKSQPQMAVIPERRTGTAAHAAGLSMKTTKRFLSGDVPDPARIKHHPTSFWIKLSALLNVVAGTAYIWWRAARSMPEDPVSPVWNWLFFAGECILVVGIWTSHLQRSFPSVRDVCTMDDLVDIDSSVADEALVCIMVPTAGEKMKNLKHVLLGAYSQRLWATKGPANRQLRVAVLDEKGRHEVRDLVEKVYHLAQNLVNPVVQQELCSKFDEPFITPKIFMDYYNQMDALDKFVFREECHPAFDMALRMENYSGAKTHGLGRGSSSSGLRKNKGKAKGPAARLEEGFKQLFYTSPNIPSMIYSARANPGTPKVSPKAGNMNAAIFPNSPGEEPVIGDAARVVIVNDARHRLKTDFLQRTVPYFFKLDRRSGKNYNWADVGYVQTPQRFEDLGDGDPLGNHAVLTFFVSNVSKDGVGGVTSCGQGSLWRVDALRGMAADGRQTVDHKKSPETIGHDCGFRAEVLIEDTHTSLEFFKLQWRSAYVCEAGETLAVCVEQPNTVAWRVKQVFRWHIGAVQLLLKDGIGFLCTSKMPTPLHKMFGLDSLTYYIQAVGGIFIILMPIMFSIFQETPFNTVDLEFVYFFFPFIITATFPTILAVGWKNVNPNRVLTDEQFWLSTCYVQVWAFALGVWNRVTCANPDNAWNLVCPVWPLGLIFCLLILSCINTTIYWMYYLEFDKDGIWIFLASFGACLVVMYSIWPMVKLWWPGWVALPSAYHQKFCYILIFIALTSVLATFIDL